MCVNSSVYPLVKLTDGKRKVLFNYGVIVENRDFTPFDDLKLDWRYALKGLSKRQSFNDVVKHYGIIDFEKYTSVPCGKCEDCLKSKARGWAFRILKEASLYENNFFLTLTYDDDHLPYSKAGINTLVKDEISKTNPNLLEWSALDFEKKEANRNTFKNLPDLCKRVDLKIVKN